MSRSSPEPPGPHTYASRRFWDENDITRELAGGIVTLWEIRDNLHLLIWPSDDYFKRNIVAQISWQSIFIWYCYCCWNLEAFFYKWRAYNTKGITFGFLWFFYASRLEWKVKFILRVICHSVAEVRFRNLNPPTFCLICSIITRLWIHEMPTCGSCYVCNAIRTNYSETIREIIIFYYN